MIDCLIDTQPSRLGWCACLTLLNIRGTCLTTLFLRSHELASLQILQLDLVLEAWCVIHSCRVAALVSNLALLLRLLFDLAFGMSRLRCRYLLLELAVVNFELGNIIEAW